MCGIAGFITPAPLDDRTVAAVGDSIAHRGPDDSGLWRGRAGEAHVTLVHRRLSIIGLADGHQPMSTPDGRLTVVYNGEIYNDPELRRSLAADGAVLRTSCDTEVLLHLYERHGAEMVHHLRGMFALAIWDAREGVLFLARDHLGQKPLFYAHDPVRGTFAFASEIKALLASGLVEPRVDMDALWHHTGLRFCPGDTSLIAGVRKLGPAERAVFDPGAGRLRTERYWTLDYRDKERWSFDEALDRLEELLSESVRAHLLADVRTGCFLSGGIDSSTVAALAVKHAGPGWPTFSIGVGDEDYSELPAARLAAGVIGTEHHERVVDPDLFLMLPDMVWHLEEPGDQHAVGIWLLSAMARERVKVCLGGAGGDEAFGGYTRFARSRLLDLYSAVPRGVRSAVLGPLVRAIPQGGFSYYTLAGKARWAHEMSMRTGAARQALALTYFRFTAEERERIFTPEALTAVGNPDTDRFIAQAHDAEVCETELDRVMYTEQMTRMAEHDLRVADRMSMAHSLELRAPIVDREVMAFAARLPAEFKVKPGRLKIILRELCRRHYPDGFVDRPKYGFAFPMARWFAGEMAPFVQRVIDSGGVFEQGVLRRDRAQALFDEHRAGRADHNFKLWAIINLEVWHRLFVGGESREDCRAWLAECLGRQAARAGAGAGA